MRLTRFIPFAALIVGGPALADVVSYECNSFPDEDGWDVGQEWCNPEQWVADGSGDFDTSGTVDATDFYFFSEYFSGDGVNAGPGARWADFDADTDVDCTDWDAFTAAWTDPGDPPVFHPCLVGGIPAVSAWGVAVMALLVLTTATLVFGGWTRNGSFGPTVENRRAGWTTYSMNGNRIPGRRASVTVTDGLSLP